MKVAYIFSTPNAHYILSNMIVPQLEAGKHGFDILGMFFFVDNTFLLVKGNDIGDRLEKIVEETGMMLMACDKCAFDRRIADDLVENAKLGCFPDLHEALKSTQLDQVITL
jgi:hypothetical protein